MFGVPIKGGMGLLFQSRPHLSLPLPPWVWLRRHERGIKRKSEYDATRPRSNDVTVRACGTDGGPAHMDALPMILSRFGT